MRRQSPAGRGDIRVDLGRQGLQGGEALFLPQAGDELHPEDKVALVGLLNMDVGMPRGKMSVLSAIEHTIESLARVYDGGSDTLLELPTLIGLEQHRLEC